MYFSFPFLLFLLICCFCGVWQVLFLFLFSCPYECIQAVIYVPLSSISICLFWLYISFCRVWRRSQFLFILFDLLLLQSLAWGNGWRVRSRAKVSVNPRQFSSLMYTSFYLCTAYSISLHYFLFAAFAEFVVGRPVTRPQQSKGLSYVPPFVFTDHSSHYLCIMLPR